MTTPCWLILENQLLLLKIVPARIKKDKWQWSPSSYMVKQGDCGIGYGQGAGAQALNLLFGRARSSCMTYHRPCAKLLPSSPLNGGDVDSH